MESIEKYINKKIIKNKEDIVTIIKNYKFLFEMNEKKHETFIYNLDKYISFLKKYLTIDIYQFRYIIYLTLNGNENILYSNVEYINNKKYFQNEFKKLFLNNYYKNMELLNIKKFKFNSLITLINKNKRRIFALFENIDSNNIFFYKTIIDFYINN